MYIFICIYSVCNKLKALLTEIIYDIFFNQGQAKLFLTLVPTLPPDGPLERCWSPWGQQREAERLEKEKEDKKPPSSLPSCTLFVTLPALKLTLEATQALQLWKWLEFCFILHGT